MRLAGLRVDGWGILQDLTLGEKELGPGLNVLYGPNETGKSTLLSFIRAVLFGFRVANGACEPLRGGRPGGHLVLEDNGRAYRVERYGKGNGKVTVELPGGEIAGEEYLRARILRGAGPVLFNNVFALGMDELRRLEDLEKDEISAYIYGAGTGASPRRLAAALAELEKTADNLFRPRGRTQELNRLIQELDGLKREIRALEEQQDRYLELRDKLAALEREKDILRGELAAERRRAEQLGQLVRARNIWLELRECMKTLHRRQGRGQNRGDVDEMLELLDRVATDLDRLNGVNRLLEERRRELGQVEERLSRLNSARRQAGQARLNPWPGVAALVMLGGPGVWMVALEINWGVLLAAAGLALAALSWAVPAARAGERKRREEELREELSLVEKERVGALAQLNGLEEERRVLEESLRRAARSLTGREILAREDIPVLRRELLVERDLQNRVQELRRQLADLAGSPAELALMERELEAGGDLAGELEQLHARMAEREERLQRLVEETAGVKREMAVLESGEELARARQKREILRAELAGGAGRWQKAVLARALLELAREKYERERQPAVLALASDYIGPMTGGRYRRVVAPLGAARMLEVEEPGGRRVPARALSRGAAAQLYLAVRLALARHLGQMLAPMPIILDDVLVDFDSERLRGALAVLGRAAEKQQVILFTCHEHILAAAREAAPGSKPVMTDFSHLLESRDR